MIIRRDFVNRLLEDRKDNLRVVSGIGTSTWDLMSTGDEKNNFGFIGAMGQALPFALGLSIAQPDKKILLITGDGDTSPVVIVASSTGFALFSMILRILLEILK